MKTTVYTLAGATADLRAAVIADFHDGDPAPVLQAVRDSVPDIVLLPGDMVHDRDRAEQGLALLRGLAALYPTFCTLGNHEYRCDADIKDRIRETGAQLLDNAFVTFGGLVIGGLSSGYEGKKQGRLKKTPAPPLAWLDDFCKAKGTHVLLSHHPEYYPRFLCNRQVELVLSGHAHGGQWCFFERGVFAPGQGLFPRFTHGAYRGMRLEENRTTLSATEPLMIVSRGLANEIGIPRFGNPEELIVINFCKG